MRKSSKSKHTGLGMAFLVAGTCSAVAIGPTQELPSGGLVFVVGEKVQIEREDLIIALDRIEVTYVMSSADKSRVSLAMAFPLPTIDLAALQGTDVAVPAFDPANPTNFVGFWTLIDGQPVEPEVDVRAVAVGHIDVTRRLLEVGLPLYPLADDIADKLATLPTDVRDDLVDASILTVVDDVTRPIWALQTVFHWRAAIAGSAAVTIQHHYKPITGSTKWSAEFAETARKKYCLSNEAVVSLDRRAAAGKAPTVYWVHYHPAANSWVKGTSETFRLTIDKGAGMASTCVPGLRAASGTTLELVATDRSDESDIDVLFVE
jgi:hypothetical protein